MHINFERVHAEVILKQALGFSIGIPTVDEMKKIIDQYNKVFHTTYEFLAVGQDMVTCYVISESRFDDSSHLLHEVLKLYSEGVFKVQIVCPVEM